MRTKKRAKELKIEAIADCYIANKYNISKTAKSLKLDVKTVSKYLSSPEAKNHFAWLSEARREKWLGWIEKGVFDSLKNAKKTKFEDGARILMDIMGVSAQARMAEAQKTQNAPEEETKKRGFTEEEIADYKEKIRKLK